MNLVKTFKNKAKRASYWKRYLHALVGANCWNTNLEILTHRKLKEVGLDQYPVPYMALCHTINWKHARNPSAFANAIQNAASIFPRLKSAMRRGDIDTIVKMRVGLGYKGASLLLNLCGHKYAVLDRHVIRYLDGHFNERVQSSRERYMRLSKHCSPDRSIRVYLDKIGEDKAKELIRVGF